MKKVLESQLLLAMMLSILSLIVCPLPKSKAAITPTGNVSPSDPTTWTSSTTAYIGKTTNGTVTVDGGSKLLSDISFLGNVTGSSGSVTITGAGSIWTNNRYFYDGFEGTGTLNIEAGGLISTNYGSLGYDSSSDGTATITGTNSKWINSNALWVGDGGKGILNIKAGGLVSDGYAHLGFQANSIGMATVTGSESKWINNGELWVGYYGHGTLTVTNGGSVTANTIFASLSDLYGDGTITANGAILDTDFIFDGLHGLQKTIDFGTGGTLNLTNDGSGSLGAGHKSNGTIKIADGVTVASHGGCLGYMLGSNGSATVTGAGSTWNVHYGLTVGSYGNGTLNIEDGAQVISTDSTHIGFFSGSNSTVKVSGNESKLTSGVSLYVGEMGTATLTIEQGGQVVSANGYVSYQSNLTSSAIVSGSGSIWTNTGRLCLGYRGNGNLSVLDGGMVIVNGILELGFFGTGKLNVDDGGMVTAGTLYASLDDMSGNGTINANGAILDTDLIFDGAHGLKQTFSFGSGGVLDLTISDSSILGAGHKGVGTLNIADGMKITSLSGCLGYCPNSIGKAIVGGEISKWSISNNLIVGSSGNGSLLIDSGGQVSDSTGYVGYNGYSSGIVTVTGKGSVWTNSSNLYVGYQGNGSLNIDVGGQVNNVAAGVLGYSSGSSGLATISGSGSMWSNAAYINIGYSGNGTLNIEERGQVVNTVGIIANNSGATGIATITGYDSKWTNNGELYIGYSGKGTLTIKDSGLVSDWTGYLGFWNGSIGKATIVGLGSLWTNRDALYIGQYGKGTLNIIGGGEVKATNVFIQYYQAILVIDVGTGSKLSVADGNGIISNSGKIRIISGANTTANTIYYPILAKTWKDNGIYQAVGGKWDATVHMFTVSGVQGGDSGTAVNIDRLNTQRVLIGDSGSGWKLGASFVAATASAPLSFTATAIGGGTLDALRGTSGVGDVILGGWTLVAASGYTKGDPVYLSFGDGISGYADDNMKLWSYDGTKWSDITPNDLIYDGAYANFTTTAMGCFAVTVPEPSMGVLLGIFVSGLVMVARYRRGR